MLKYFHATKSKNYNSITTWVCQLCSIKNKIGYIHKNECL